MSCIGAGNRKARLRDCGNSSIPLDIHSDAEILIDRSRPKSPKGVGSFALQEDYLQDIRARLFTGDGILGL